MNVLNITFPGYFFVVMTHEQRISVQCKVPDYSSQSIEKIFMYVKIAIRVYSIHAFFSFFCCVRAHRRILLVLALLTNDAWTTRNPRILQTGTRNCSHKWNIGKMCVQDEVEHVFKIICEIVTTQHDALIPGSLFCECTDVWWTWEFNYPQMLGRFNTVHL